MMNYVYLSIGSNIQPEINLSQVYDLLIKKFGKVLLFPACVTEPVGIATHNKFVNSVAVVKSDETYASLKQQLKQIEQDLGRKIGDPLASKKDRVADIDIIAIREQLDFETFEASDEPYVRDILVNKDKLQTFNVHLGHTSLPDYPAAVHYNGRAGNEVVINQEIHSF